jgi:hypothetical protein
MSKPIIHLGTPPDINYLDFSRFVHENIGDKHVIIASYIKEGFIHTQCSCGDTHDFDVGTIKAAESKEPLCYCGYTMDYTGGRCFACPDKK